MTARRTALVRVVSGVLLMLLCGNAAQAQERMLRWRTDVENAISEAKKRNMPLMFYITRASDSRDQDIERDQKRSFQDPRVFEMSRKFICVQMSRSQYKDQIEKWGIRSNMQLYVVYCQPDGTKIDWQDPLGVATPQGFAEKMARVFAVHRKAVYETDVKPKLVEEKAPAADLKAALETVRQLNVLDADADVAKLLTRKDLDDKTRTDVYDTLAALSTKLAVDALLAEVKAADDPAAKALQETTPGAAPLLLPSLDKEGPQQVAAYNAVVKTCKIKNPKPPRFWEGKNERVKREELERVKKQAEQVARRWKEQYEPYR